MKKTRLLFFVILGTAAACSSNNSSGGGGGKGGGGGAGGGGGLGGAGGMLPSDAAVVDGSPDASTDVSTQDAATTFTVSGTIVGLTGSGLVLRNNGADDLTVPAGATTFSFPVAVPMGATYAVSVAKQPTTPAQTCVVTGGTGTIGAANAGPIVVTCTTGAFTIGGTISGLTGTGLVLQDNAGDDLIVPAAATTFTFATPVGSGGAYAVTVLTQPSAPAQVCTVDSGAGTVGNDGVTNVAITCVPKKLTVGGTITGLTGTGLVLQDNAGDNLVVAAGATTFTFATPVDSGSPYAVTVLTAPTGPTQTCTVGAGTGTVGDGDVTSVTITCATKTFSVGGTISGLTGTGMVLRNNGGDSLTVPAAATSFTFATPVASGGAFAVTVFTQPSSPAQNCVVSGGNGTVGTAAVTSVVINCSADKFTVGGTVTGLQGVVVLHNGSDSQAVSGNGMFAFPTPVTSGGTYAVTVASQPTGPSQTCTVTNGMGMVTGANVTSVTVSCTTNSFHVQAVVSGLSGNGLILRNNSEPVLANMNGTYTFPSTVLSGSPYAVMIAVQPTTPSQTCTVGANAAGVVGAADISVAVTCVTNLYNVRVTVSGLSGSGLILKSGADSVPVAASSTFNMPTKVASGTSYQVVVTQQPTTPSQTCTVTPAAPAIVGGADAQVSVSCATNSFKILGQISGVMGTGLVLQNNGGNDTAVAPGAMSFMFSSSVPSGGTYNVTVKTQPSGPPQTCTPASTMGTVGNGDVTVVLTCTTNKYAVNAKIVNLTSNGLVLQDNGGDNLTVPASANNTTVPFATKVVSGQPYAVTVLTAPTTPTKQTCVVTPPSGVVAAMDVTVTVDCSGISIGGTVVGLAGTGLVLRDNGADDLMVPMSSTTFTFGTKLQTGDPYAVTVAASPANQFCQVTANDSGVAMTSNVTNVAVDCAVCNLVGEANTFTLSCPAGQTITSFDFASYGLPSGTCGAYVADPNCNSAMTAPTMATCIGMNTCSLFVNNVTFNDDPCPFRAKALAVQARCH